MTKKEQIFVAEVWEFYREQGRHDLPWRQTHTPYNILVSELMLQQTQVARVIPKYEAFVKRWPTAKRLATASLGDVLRMWQGLGYNRRAKFLLECVQVIAIEHKGIFPTTYEQLLPLPGIGPYTAAAICAFAYNQPVELIETNVRQVYIHHFFNKKESVTDVEILKKVRATLPIENAREWYAAIMDYGSYLKQLHGNNTKQSKSYKKQSTFKGSNREVRGAIVRLLANTHVTKQEMVAMVAATDKQILLEQLGILVKDGLVVCLDGAYQLP